MRTAIPTIGGGAGELVRETRAGAEQHPSLGDRTARESARGRRVGAATPGVRDEVAETGGGHASTPRVPARPAPPAFSRLSSRPFLARARVRVVRGSVRDSRAFPSRLRGAARAQP